MASSPYTGCELLYLSSFSLRLAPVLQCVTRLIVCVPLSCYKVKLASTMHSCFLFWQLECGYKHVVSLSMFCVTSSKQVPDSVYKSVVTLLKHRYVQEKQDSPETDCSSDGVKGILLTCTPNLRISHTYHCHTSPIPGHSNLELTSKYHIFLWKKIVAAASDQRNTVYMMSWQMVEFVCHQELHSCL